ncbi:MAG TPA: hypothetical protein VN665_03430 [Candidatus Paceibacterota bacterium]|nr:hypothetical protein [Candidatus Paceibacterota bacterium]
MDSIHFLNLEYFILLVYRVFTGASAGVDVSQIPMQTLYLMTRIAWTGLILFAVFAILIVYAYRRLHEVEHAGWHNRAEAAYKLHQQHTAVVAPKNPQWEQVVRMANSPLESDWRRAILEADIMLGNLLKSRGFRGQTIGDMLKDANPIQFTTLDMAWSAHKIRNHVAHGGEGFVLTDRETRGTIDLYKRVFEEFDYI